MNTLKKDNQKKKKEEEEKGTVVELPNVSKKVPFVAPLRIGGARRGRGGKAVLNSRAMVRARQEESIEASRKMKEAMAAQKARHNRGDVFESDNVLNMQLKNTETNDLFAKKDDKRVEQPLTSKELSDMEDPDAKEEREKQMDMRLKQLEDALPENVRAIDNLSAQHRKGERKLNDRFRGSLVDYIFLLQEEVEKANAKEMKERSLAEWTAWHENMYRKHQPFSDDHYKWFRTVVEGKLDENPVAFNLLVLSKLHEKKKITEGECNKLASEYNTIQGIYPQMRKDVEEHKKLREQRLRREKEAKEEEVVGKEAKEGEEGGEGEQVKEKKILLDAEFVGSEGHWRWWEEKENTSLENDMKIPSSFIQFCLSVKFNAESSDYESLKHQEDYELIVCSRQKGEEKERKSIRFMKNSDSDDFAQRNVSEQTIRSWIAGDAVTDRNNLNANSHLFIIDRSDPRVEKWTLLCYNCIPNESWFEATK